MKKLITMVAALALAGAAFAIEISVGARGNLDLSLGSAEYVQSGAKSAKQMAENNGNKLSQSPFVGGGFAVYANLGLVDLGPVKLGIQPEFDMNFHNGWSYTVSYKSGGWGKLTRTIDTIDIPLIVTVSAPINDTIKVGGGIGPYLSIPFGKPTQILEFSYKDDIKYSYDDTKFNYKVNFGMAFDGNIGFKVGPGFIVADIRYMLDFTPVAVKSYTDQDGTETLGEEGKLFYRRSLNIGVGYEFKF